MHRRGTATSSRASSRKSSRASDASDLSELAGPWLNLPLMLVGGANDVIKDTKPEDERRYTKHANISFISILTPFAYIHSIESGSRTPRRKSFYNFFLRHQDAVDDCLTSPSVHRKPISPSGTLQSLCGGEDNRASAILQSTPKSKRATSFVRKKPPLERGLSAQSALRINKNPTVGKLS